MEPRKRPEYVLEVLADPTCVKDVVRGILHTIFFHRYFPSMRPSSLEVLDLTLPVVADPELETLIDTRVGQLVRQLSSTSSPSGGSRGELGVRFFEKHRRKASGLGGWLTGTGKSEEEVCRILACNCMEEIDSPPERTTLLRAEAPSLHKTAMTIVKIVNRDKDHIPPITTSETNPFPYEILLNPRAEYDGKTIGFFS
ncbi:MAG: hypothetical protein Q9186_004477 [Xanthomendoza sp. 1 TL-2023]